jgi:small GTP-binding protein
MAKAQQPHHRRSEPQALALPNGISLVRTFEGHTDSVLSLCFDPTGRTLASGGFNEELRLWDILSKKEVRTIAGRHSEVMSLTFDPLGRILASAGRTTHLWDVVTGRPLRTLQAKGALTQAQAVAIDPRGRLVASASDMVRLWELSNGNPVRTLTGSKRCWALAFHPSGRLLASGTDGGAVRLWEAATGKLVGTLEGHKASVWSVAFDSAGGRILASASRDRTIKLWDVSTAKLLRTLEGHTDSVGAVAFSSDARILASKSDDGTVRLWSCDSWETLAVIQESTRPKWPQALAFHPKLPMMATSGSRPGTVEMERSRLIHLWRFDVTALVQRLPALHQSARAVHHTTAKIVLVGDHSVGKSALGYRLAHGKFKEQSSTHGQQFWVLPQLRQRRHDGTECEAILWDLAGQPDYRLIHALFLDDVDLALVLFDSCNLSDPLHGVEFWLKQLSVRPSAHGPGSETPRVLSPTILVGAQSDRGTPTLTREDIEAFCRHRGISGYISTSAKEGWGLEELLDRMKRAIPWDDKASTVTTLTFKRIKEYVLKLKEVHRGEPIVVDPGRLRKELEGTDQTWSFTDAELRTALAHLENYGYVKRLRSSKGQERILLAPELLNNLAASFILEARRNPKGLGSLEESRLLADDYHFAELNSLSIGEREILIDSATLLFLEHNVCFRETDPLSGKSYLVFPELINLKMPYLEGEQSTEDGVMYAVSGAIENVYASLVVLLGYTQTFTRTDQWRSQTRYEVGDRLICGFRQDAERDGEVDFVLYFGRNVGQPVRTLFQGLVESFLARRNVDVFRYEPVTCGNCHHPLDRGVVRDRLRSSKDFAFCAECGERLVLPKADEPIQLTQTERHRVEEQQRFATRRSRFEQAVFQLVSFLESQKAARPDCFVSYAWGDRGQEWWVERTLAPDLQKAGLSVILDRWENERVGASVPRFIERIESCDRIVVIGTPLYRMKYENQDTDTGYVVAAEVDLIANRLLGTEASKESVFPVLLAGDKKSSLPPLLHSRVLADFRSGRDYFATAFDLILDLYGIAHNAKAVADLRDSLRSPTGQLSLSA